MSRDLIESYYFVLVVVRKASKFLLVHERKHGQLWYLPAGGVDAGETFIEAAQRETLEEAGMPIKVNGIIRLEHTPTAKFTRVRLLVTASTVDETEPKNFADSESVGAAWFTIEAMKSLNLRDPSLIDLFTSIENEELPIAPISLLGSEF